MKRQRSYRAALLVVLALLGFIILPPLGTWLAEQPQTGFGPYTITESTQVTRVTQSSGDQSETSITSKPQREKNLWDWIQLVVVPLVLLLIGAFINSTIQKNQDARTTALSKAENERTQELAKIERERMGKQFDLTREQNAQQFQLAQKQAADQLEQSQNQQNESNREAALQIYLSRMSDLLITNNPYRKEFNANVSLVTPALLAVLHAYTLSVMNTVRLDSDRSSVVKIFLDNMQVHFSFGINEIPEHSTLSSDSIESLSNLFSRRQLIF